MGSENTPDAVEVAREAIAKRYDSLTAKEVRAGKFDDGSDVKHAILGARAMQAAMPAPAGVRVKALEDAMRQACDLLAERTHGSPARSPGHNARLLLEAALSAIEDAGAREGEGVGHSQKVAVVGHLDHGKTTLATAVALVMAGRAAPTRAGGQGGGDGE